MPDWIPPMLATLTDQLPAEGPWIYEPKLDGIRALVYVTRGSARIYSRNRKLLNEAYPELVEALSTAAFHGPGRAQVGYNEHNQRELLKLWAQQLESAVAG